MNLEQVKERIKIILEHAGLELYSIRTKGEFGMSILEITVDGDDLSTDHLGLVNRSINDAIDDILPDHYYLEVASPGAIRPIRSLEEAHRYIGKYIHFKSDRYNEEGTLEKITGDVLYIKVNLKGRFKTFEVKYGEISTLETAIKF